jgi:hypothetical protein
LWKEMFEADRGVLGRTTRLNGVPYLIVGVMPERFQPVGIDARLWISSSRRSRCRTAHGTTITLVGIVGSVTKRDGDCAAARVIVCATHGMLGANGNG